MPLYIHRSRRRFTFASYSPVLGSSLLSKNTLMTVNLNSLVTSEKRIDRPVSYYQRAFSYLGADGKWKVVPPEDCILCGKWSAMTTTGLCWQCARNLDVVEDGEWTELPHEARYLL